MVGFIDTSHLFSSNRHISPFLLIDTSHRFSSTFSPFLLVGFIDKSHRFAPFLFKVDDAGAKLSTCSRKVDIRLPGKGNSNSRGARPVYSFRCSSGLGPVGCQKKTLSLKKLTMQALNCHLVQEFTDIEPILDEKDNPLSAVFSHTWTPTLNPEPQTPTLSPKSSTLNPPTQVHTRNPKPNPRPQHPQPYTPTPKPHTIHLQP